MIDHIRFDDHVKSYQHDQAKCVELIHLAHQLWLTQAIDLFLFGTPIRDKSGGALWKVYQQQSLRKGPICLQETLNLAKLLQNLVLPIGPLDIGELILQVMQEPNPDKPIAELVDTIRPFPVFRTRPKDVILYGFGRIGRLLARELMSGLARDTPLRLRAIVTRDVLDEETIEKRANLLRCDSIHGAFDADIRTDVKKARIIVNGIPIQLIRAREPEAIDYSEYGIQDALILDNTGAFRSRAQLSRHLTAPGASAVVLTAPGKDMPNIVMGVNDRDLQVHATERLVSAASCTTNAIAPVLAVIQQHLGIVKGHIETIHAYTNDQNLVDNMHKKTRRGRAAALNLVITETGAGAAVAKILPDLAGKLTSNAIRVPVPNGSLAILHLELPARTDRKQLNDLLRRAADQEQLANQIHFSQKQELVSSDIIGSTSAAIVDGLATQVSSDGHSAILYLWYDNEYGYSQQVMRLAKEMVHVDQRNN